MTGVQEVEVLLEAEEEEVGVQGGFRREIGGVVGEEVEEEGEEVQNRVGQTLLNSSNPSPTRGDTAAVAKAGSTTATVRRRTSLASQKGEHLVHNLWHNMRCL